jgi:AraC-like DNA-binding protein
MAPSVRPTAGNHSRAAIGTLSVVEFMGALGALARLGFDRGAILTRARMSETIVSDPSARVSTDVEHAFWAAAEAVSGDPAIGLRVGVDHARNGTRSLLEYVATHSPTLREALMSLQSIVCLADDLGHIDLLETGDTAAVSIRRDGIDRARGYVDSLCALAVTFYIDQLPGFRASKVSFTQERPKNRRPYVDVFQVSPEFGAALNVISFPRHFLERKFTGADVALGAHLRTHAEELLQRLPGGDPFIDGARRAIMRDLAQGEANPRKVASALGTSMRTLRRRLLARGTSYHCLLDDLRRELACHRLLQTDDSMEVIAESLGFSGTSTFQRAFRRCTGESPSEYRAKRRL